MRYGLILMFFLAVSSFQTPSFAESPISLQTMVTKVPVADGISIDEAIESMLLRAELLEMRKVAHQPMGKAFAANGLEPARRVDIYQFCNLPAAHQMLAADIGFIAFMPCRIAAIEDNDGKAWLVMMNLDFLLQLQELPPELKETAQKVRDDLMQIIEAGANGEL